MKKWKSSEQVSQANLSHKTEKAIFQHKSVIGDTLSPFEQYNNSNSLLKVNYN
jgi:hypothetical protein